MSTAALTLARRGALRYSARDALFVALALLHGLLLAALPSAPVIAIGLWWNSNTISHNFIHKPFFRSRSLNLLFSLYLSLLLGIPQSIWRDRHLAHHAGVAWRPRLTFQCAIEALAVALLWAMFGAGQPGFFLTTYLPAYLVGLSICALHGHYEHVHGATVSHYGTLYNLFFFNDGFHVEHHAWPGVHWSVLATRRNAEARTSRWPAVLRWLDLFSLESLERLALRFSPVRAFLLAKHERAFRRLLRDIPVAPRRVGIVGGGLFPRTALVLQRLLPDAKLEIIDASAENLRTALEFLKGQVTMTHGWYDPGRHAGFDTLVFPLDFTGDREVLYCEPPASLVFFHDWVWHRRGTGVVVSWLLLKRLNLLRLGDAARPADDQSPSSRSSAWASQTSAPHHRQPAAEPCFASSDGSSAATH